MSDKEYIEKSKLIESWEREIKDATDLRDAFDFALEDVPTADVVEVVHARWDEDEYPFCNVCMECGLVIDRTCIKYSSGKLNFCPHCGARMDGGIAVCRFLANRSNGELAIVQQDDICSYGERKEQE